MKKMIRIGAAGALGVLFVSLTAGCGQGGYAARGSWDWTPPRVVQVSQPAGNSDAVLFAPGQANAGFFAYAPGSAPEFDRRDESLNIVTNDPYAGWMGFPVAQRPSLDYQRSFYTSRSPNRYTYPSTSSSGYGNSGSYSGRYNSGRYQGRRDQSRRGPSRRSRSGHRSDQQPQHRNRNGGRRQY